MYSLKLSSCHHIMLPITKSLTVQRLCDPQYFILGCVFIRSTDTQVIAGADFGSKLFGGSSWVKRQGADFVHFGLDDKLKWHPHDTKQQRCTFVIKHNCSVGHIVRISQKQSCNSCARLWNSNLASCWCCADIKVQNKQAKERSTDQWECNNQGQNKMWFEAVGYIVQQNSQHSQHQRAWETFS